MRTLTIVLLSFLFVSCKTTETRRYNIPAGFNSDAIMAAAEVGNVDLLPNVYYIDKPVKLKEGRSIRAMVTGATTFIMHTNSTYLMTPANEQFTMLIVWGGTIDGIVFDCAVPELKDAAIGGAIAWWGTGYIKNCKVKNFTNGKEKEGFALFSNGTVENCEALYPVEHFFGPEISAIAAKDIISCRVDCSNLTPYPVSKTVTHAFTLLSGGKVLNSKAIGCTVGYYTDSHKIENGVVSNNEFLDCYMAIQLSGRVDDKMAPRLNAKNINMEISNNKINNSKVGIYLYAPIAYENGDKTKPWIWHDGTKILRNTLTKTENGVKVQAAHYGFLGRVHAENNSIESALHEMIIDSQYVANGGLVTQLNNKDEKDNPIDWFIIYR